MTKAYLSLQDLSSSFVRCTSTTARCAGRDTSSETPTSLTSSPSTYPPHVSRYPPTSPVVTPVPRSCRPACTSSVHCLQRPGSSSCLQSWIEITIPHYLLAPVAVTMAQLQANLVVPPRLYQGHASMVSEKKIVQHLDSTAVLDKRPLLCTPTLKSMKPYRVPHVTDLAVQNPGLRSLRDHRPLRYPLPLMRS